MIKIKTLLIALSLPALALSYMQLADAYVSPEVCGNLLSAAAHNSGSTDQFSSFVAQQAVSIKQCASQCGNYDWANTHGGALTDIARAQSDLAASATCKRQFTQLMYYSNYALGYSTPPGSAYTEAAHTNFAKNDTDNSSASFGDSQSGDQPQYTPRKSASVPDNNHISFW